MGNTMKNIEQEIMNYISYGYDYSEIDFSYDVDTALIYISVGSETWSLDITDYDVEEIINQLDKISQKYHVELIDYTLKDEDFFYSLLGSEWRYIIDED